MPLYTMFKIQKYYIFELSLAVFSYAYFKVSKILLSGLAKIVSKNRQDEEWNTLDGELIEKPLILASLMLNAPRWNTHAIIGFLDINVKKSLNLSTVDIADSASCWNLEIQDSTGNSVALLSSWQTESLYPIEIGENEINLQLPEDKYTIRLRCYENSKTVIFPGLFSDSGVSIPSKVVNGSLNNFYLSLGARRTIFYTMLNYYIYVMLKYEKGQHSKFISEEFLPAGNPETYFMFGYIDRGIKMDVKVAPSLFDNHYVYYNIYDTASFPLLCGKLDCSDNLTKEATADGYYLLRICQYCDGEPYDSSQIKITFISQGAVLSNRQVNLK